MMLTLFGLFFIMLLLGAPIVVALGVSAMSVYILNGDDFSSMIVLAYNAVDSFPIMAQFVLIFPYLLTLVTFHFCQFQIM